MCEVGILSAPIAQLQVVLEFNEELVVGLGGPGATETGVGMEMDLEPLVFVEHEAVEPKAETFCVLNIGDDHETAALACIGPQDIPLTESGRAT